MWNDLNNLSAKDLKKIAEWMWLVKWEDFQVNASKKDMLVLIESQNNDGGTNIELEKIAEKTAKKESKKIELTIENTGTDNNLKYEIITPIKRNGKILKKWDSVEYFDWVKWLIKDWIIKES